LEIRGELKQKPTYNEEEAKHDSEPDPSDRNRETLPKARRKRTKPLKGRDQDQWNGHYAIGTSKEKKKKKKKKKTELDLNSSTMCSVRAHEIIRDTMSPESVSVDGSDSSIGPQTVSQNQWRLSCERGRADQDRRTEYLGSARYNTIGPTVWPSNFNMWG
jgi:hypothetical protein